MSLDRMTVSVVIPAYNVERTLARAVRSVLAQTRLPDEIVVVDDASTDATWPLAERLAAEAGVVPVRAMRLPANGGASVARNTGWETATGSLIAFLDADDAWHPRKLEIQAAWMESHPGCALCGHPCLVMHDTDPPPRLPPETPSVYRYGLRDFLVRNRFSTPSVMLRREVEERFSADKRYSEDYLLWMQIVAHHGTAACIDLPLAFLYKDRYGVSGLSGNLWRMQRGELDTLARLRRASTIGAPLWLACSLWSCAKFGRRLIGNQRRALGGNMD